MAHRRLRIAITLLATLLVLAPPLQAQGEDPNPDVHEWADATYRLAVQEGLSDLVLTGEVGIHEVDPPGSMAFVCPRPCTADDIRELYQQGSSSEKRQLKAVLENEVAERAQRALEAIAGEGDSEVTARVVEATLTAPDGGSDFHPAIQVDVTGQATIGLLDTSAYTQRQIDAVFQMGAVVAIPLQDTVPAGTNLTLEVTVPAPLGFMDVGDGTVEEGPNGTALARWSLANAAGSSSVQLDETVRIGRTDVAVPDEEEGELDITIDLSSLNIHYSQLLGEGPPASMDLAVRINGTFQALAVPGAVPAPL
ncbi:MAG: hypothetical protein R3185_04195, partial [Candidatus Thermoplasmatota archaeon]|nr:hypothetical protein [Candidatus Thermoplasmatota archaeon]